VPISPKGNGGGGASLGYIPATVEGTEGTSTGMWRHGDNRGTKNDIGVLAIDLSYSEDNATQKGASGTYSVAVGINTLASAYAANAEGTGCKATGMSSHAEGSASVASGVASHVEGYSSTASGDFSHAGGTGCTASGEASFASGYNCVAAGAGSTVLGHYCSSDSTSLHSLVSGGNVHITSNSYDGLYVGNVNTVSSAHTSLIGGWSNTVAGSSASLIGGNSLTISSANNALVTGASHTITGPTYSFVTGIGHNISLGGFGFFAMGKYSTPLVTGEQGKIGIGVSAAAKADAVIVYTDGTVTLPTSTPTLNYSRGAKAIVTKEQLDDRFEFGTVSITPSSANTPTAQAVTFTKTYATPPFVSLTLLSAVPGGTVTGYAISAAPTTTGFSAVVTRTNTTQTVFQWMAVRT